MATLRELKGRIGSVASSEKITGAMKMISSAKMHKAEQALRQLKPYRSQIETIIANLLSADVDFNSPLLESREVKSIGLLLLGSDDGLCGAYNVNIYKKAVELIEGLKNEYPAATITVLPVGNKIAKQAVKLQAAGVKIEIIPGIDSKSTAEVINEFAAQLRDSFLSGTYDMITALSTHFYTVSRQRIESVQVLPVQQASITSVDSADSKPPIKPYIFEPSPEAIVDTVLPLFQLALMQDLFTQNMASEQAARVMAMQSANDNAQKLLEQLQLEYNKLRQQSITTELLDIVGGQSQNN
ncbi:MAG: ATP synthase F1 subunit gamma [Muribaculaceae bacterium]|nr:ATP synthase F1 subunit gamma [Muribaculaceae bacterium]